MLTRSERGTRTERLGLTFNHLMAVYEAAEMRRVELGEKKICWVLCRPKGRTCCLQRVAKGWKSDGDYRSTVGGCERRGAAAADLTALVAVNSISCRGNKRAEK